MGGYTFTLCRDTETRPFDILNVLGEQNVLILKNHQLSLDEQYVWVDTWAMSRLFEPAQQSIKIKNTAQSIELASKLMQYYRGHFFPVNITAG